MMHCDCCTPLTCSRRLQNGQHHTAEPSPANTARRSLHGPQSGGFYVCTLRTEPPPVSTFRTLSHSVGAVLKSTLKMIYTRQSDYIRRYFAQSEDMRELSRLVSHISSLLSDALPCEPLVYGGEVYGRRSGDGAEEAGWEGHEGRKAEGQGACDSQSTQCHGVGSGDGHCRQGSSSVVMSSGDASATSAPKAATASGNDDAGASTSAGVWAGIDPTGDSEAVVDDVAGGAAAAAFEERESVASTADGAGQGRDPTRSAAPQARPGEPQSAAHAAAASAVAEPSPAKGDNCGSATASALPPTVGCGVVPWSGRSGQRPRLSAESPMGCILAEWERSVETGRSVLRNTCIATFYMDRCAEREYLEALQVCFFFASAIMVSRTFKRMQAVLLKLQGNPQSTLALVHWSSPDRNA
jgi:hypothetical protein